MGEANEVDPYKMMSSGTDDQVLLGVETSPTDILNDPSLVNSMGGGGVQVTPNPSGPVPQVLDPTIYPLSNVPQMPPPGFPTQLPPGTVLHQPFQGPTMINPANPPSAPVIPPGANPYGHPAQQPQPPSNQMPNNQNPQQQNNSPFGT